MPNPHGGKRPGAGRKPERGARQTIRSTVWMTEADAAELTAGLREGETLSDLLRAGGLALVRRRREAT